MKPGKMIKVSSIPWVVIVLAFVLLYAAYFFLYIPQQESLVEKRAFRILKEFAGNMKDKLEYYETHLKNYSPYYSIKHLSENEEPGFSDTLELAIRNNRQVETLIANLEKTITTSKSETGNYKESLIFVDGEYKVVFSGANASDVMKVLDRFVPGFIENRNREKMKLSFEHKVPVSTFMENLKFDKLLENIAIFSDSAAIYNTNLEVIQDITNPGILADTLHKLQGGLNAKINIRGEKNQVMVLPFTFLGKQLYLAGFIPDYQFRHKTRDINNQFLITLAGILLLFLFGMPILKILFISRKERLRAIDCTASNISLIFGISFFILIMLSGMKQFVVDRQNLRLRINDISERLCENVNNDFERITQLYEDIIGNRENPKSDKALVLTVKNIFKEKYFVDQLISSIKYESDNIGKIPDEYMKKGYPLNELFLIADDGMLKKIVSRTGATSLVPVDLSRRNYYKNMKKNSTECWIYKTSSGQSQPYFIESLKSYNSGKKEVAFSFRLDEKLAKQFGAGIMAITSPMPSLFNQVLPEDVSFLIINERGEVLFHSDQSKNLHENFLNECDENMRLIGAMNHRIADIVRIEYNEKIWLAKIVPVKNTPLFHITLIDYGFKHDKNARILYYTFYFMIATFILILAGIGIMYITKLKRNNSHTKTWMFSWLLFRPEKYKEYTFLLLVQLIIMLFQFMGLLINDKPVTMFVYQSIFITFSAFATFIVIGNEISRSPAPEFSTTALPKLIFFTIMLILIVVLTGFHQNQLLLYPVAALIIMTVLIIPSARFLLKRNPLLFNDSNKNEHPDSEMNSEINLNSRRRVFHFYVFLWLMSISAVPPIQYYHSVKMQEQSLCKRDILEYAAIRNLELNQNYPEEMRDEIWYKNAAGNGIDFLKISQDASVPDTFIQSNYMAADWVYTLLPDPVTKGNHLVGLLRNESHHSEWWRENDEKALISKMVNDNVLYYSKAGKDGQIKIEKFGSFKLNAGKWLLFFIIPVVVVIIFLWILFVYIAKIVLRTRIHDWKSPDELEWVEFLETNGHKHILLISLNSNEYLKLTRTFFESVNKSRVKEQIAFVPAGKLSVSNEIENIRDLQKAEIVWIDGLGELLKDPKEAGKIISGLSDLKGRIRGKMIIEMPFGFDFLKEYYDELLIEYALDKAITGLIRETQQKMDAFFRDFFRYTGAIYPTQTTASDDKSTDEADNNMPDDNAWLKTISPGNEPQYRFFWNNLTSHEKLILQDLSEDGMLNFKNKHLINQLKMKGLIISNPYPSIFSGGFQHFLTEVVDPEETRELQLRLGRQGKWQSMRYMILLILIPLLIFIFIAQGTSFEKVIAISTGGLAVLSGIIRLFESDLFRQAGKAK